MSTVISDGHERHYMVDPFGMGNILAEYDASGTLVNRYAYGLGLISANGAFYTFDGNGNTSELTDPTGTPVNKYLYDPFGGSLYATETRANDFEFVGQLGVMNLDNDLLYMRNRFYSPNLGRFMSEDPIGLAGGDVSFYRYVGNDPVNFVDPWGLKLDTWQNIGIGITATTAGVGSTLLISASAPVIIAVGVPILTGSLVGGFLTYAVDGNINEIAWNSATGGLGGPFGWLTKGTPANVVAMGLFGDYLMDLIWAKEDPPWESWPWEDNPCP